MSKVGDAGISANEAYYRIAVSTLPTAPVSLNLVFDDATGISLTEAGQKDEKTYDLSGRRVYNQQGKGIVIVGGKKVIRH